MLPNWQVGSRRTSSSVIRRSSGNSVRSTAAATQRSRTTSVGSRLRATSGVVGKTRAAAPKPRVGTGGAKPGGTGKKKLLKKKKKKKAAESDIVKRRKAIITRLQKGRASGSLILADVPGTPDSGNAKAAADMATSAARTPARSVASRMTTRRAGSPGVRATLRLGGDTATEAGLQFQVAPAGGGGKKKKKKGPSAKQLAQHLFSATADTALGAEVQILRAALATLTNTVVEEVDRLRQENASLKAALHASLQATHVLATDAREDARQALRQVERLSEGHGAWREDIAEVKATVAMLKDTHLPLQDRLQAVVNEVHSLEGDLLKRFSAQAEEYRARRGHVDAVLDGLRARFTDIDEVADRQRRELQAADRRRLEDMELVEKAVASVQEQLRRLRDQVTSGSRSTTTELRRLNAQARKVTGDINEVRAEAATAKASFAAAGVEANQRFDSVSQVLRALTNAVAVGGAAATPSGALASGAPSLPGGHATQYFGQSRPPPPPPRGY